MDCVNDIQFNKEVLNNNSVDDTHFKRKILY